MAIQKNFVVKNGIEVNDNLIFADKDQNTVGIGTTITPQKLQVSGGIGATSLVLTDSGTIPTLNSTTANITTGYINAGVVTSITGTGLTYTTGDLGTLGAATGNIVTGVVTTVSGTDLTYTNGSITTLNSGTVLTPSLYAVSGIVTNGTVTNLTGTAATIGTVQIASGIVTSSSGIVTYYGDGTYLSLAANPLMGIGIGTTGGVVGYGATFLDLRGAGVSTTLYDSTVGIATIFFEGGGGGGGGGAIGIGSTFPGTPLSVESPPSNGDLFFHIDYARTFIYYDEVVLGVGSSAFWIDASPFNQGLDATLAGIAFSVGTASNPSAYFVGYPDTGWFSPNPGEFGIVSYGNTVFNTNSSGVVVTGIASATGFAGTFSGTSAVFSGNSTDNIVRITQTGTGNALVVEDSTNPDTTPFVITGIGSVGIGTDDPINHLDVHGTIRVGRQDAVASGGEIVFARASDNTNAWAIDVEGDDFRVTDSSQGQTRIHIGSGGNVGLGSTATSKLHVFGDANVTGILTASGLSGSGSSLTTLNASNLSTGTVPTARLASGTADSSTYLRGDQTWASITSGITITDDTSTNATRYLTFTSATSGTISAENVSSTKLTFNPSTGLLTVVDINSTSDINLKTNINTVENSLDTVSQLRGVSFDWKETGKGSYGVIAQELEEVLPELVGTGEVKSVNYNGLVGVLIEAIKELKKEVEYLKNNK